MTIRHLIRNDLNINENKKNNTSRYSIFITYPGFFPTE